MQKNTLNIFSFILTTFVIFLSIGINISKMQCSKDGKLFIGTEVPNCMQINEIACSENSNEFSCCKQKDLLQTCCPQTNDDSCASETANFQFNFETILTSFTLNFNDSFFIDYTCLIYYKFFSFKDKFIYIGDIPFPPNLNKPKLTHIQSFLL